jgi:hypothetical protein
MTGVDGLLSLTGAILGIPSCANGVLLFICQGFVRPCQLEFDTTGHRWKLRTLEENSGMTQPRVLAVATS